jgi:sugar lactone lactonase YvrE
MPEREERFRRFLLDKRPMAKCWLSIKLRTLLMKPRRTEVGPMVEHEMQLLFRPDTPELRFLPEGPYPYGREGQFSWVAIQHSATSTTGSLNIFDIPTRTNRRFRLPGRPGFAYAAGRPGRLIVGLERCVSLFDNDTGACTPLTAEVDANVSGTVINDGTAFEGGIVFGCKDLKFAETKAGLYLFRFADKSLVQLRNDQTCSNGKIIVGQGNTLTLYDIDTPTKTVVRYSLDVAAGKLSQGEIVVDLRHCADFPDGMIATPDGRSVIISFYNPADAPHGETRQYSLSNGQLEALWKTPLAPQATCPQLIGHEGQVKLIVTTAVEHMSPGRLAVHSNSGCLFIGDTPFSDLPERPVLKIQ